MFIIMSMKKTIEIRCKRPNCNRLLFKYCVSGSDIELHMECFEWKCEKCKRLLRPMFYTENVLINNSKDGILHI